jgi:5-oxoprolinase (ATP-hydrolysing) subunit C
LLSISKAGLSSIQDAGRFGYEELGIGHGGFADPDSAHVANLLVGNPVQSPCIEICESRFELHSSHAIQIACFGAWVELCITSANMQTSRNVAAGRAVWLSAGETLRVQRWFAGRTLYLAFSGQLDLPLVLGSFSTDLANQFGGLDGRMLKNGDALALKSNLHKPLRELASNALPIPIWSSANAQGLQSLRFLAYRAELAAQLHQQRYQLTTQCTRAALRLQGPVLQIDAVLSSALSGGVIHGAIQVLPSGEPLVLGVDAQTLGGYALAGCVIQADLPQLAQLKICTLVQFECVDWLAAARLNLAYVRRRDRQRVCASQQATG